MSTLSKEKIKSVRKRRIIAIIFLFLVSLFLIPFLISYFFAFMDHSDLSTISYSECLIEIKTQPEKQKIFLVLELLILVGLFYIYTNHNMIDKSDTIKITDDIEIPKAVGEGQHGTSRFMTKKEISKAFCSIENNYKKEIVIDKNIGLVLGMDKSKKKERIYCLKNDVHTIIIGSTRSGKSRRILLPTIWLRAETGRSMVITDPKAELFLYTKNYLKSKGYKVIDFDLREPLKGFHYNYLNPIIQAKKRKDIPKAIDLTWDLVSVLVAKPKGDPLWANGESSVIAASILAIILEAPEEYQNLTNVYYFIANMCRFDKDEEEMLISKFFEKLPDTHPAKGIFNVAELAPGRTRGSFFTSALATLKLFTNPNIASMTQRSDFDLREIGEEKTALFIIMPDEKDTVYSLVSLFINQIYVELVSLANKSGNRVPVEVDFFLDEFGNLPTIPSAGSMLSVGAGRGLRFTIVLQDYQQLEKNYPNDFKNIKGNCELILFLKSPNPETLREVSDKTGTYTVQVSSASNSLSGKQFNNMSVSGSVNMNSRKLLFPEEVGKIKSPYLLLLNIGEYPAMMNAPDISQYQANKILGLGDVKHNNMIYIKRQEEREERERSEIQLWGIWNIKNDTNKVEFNESDFFNKSFLD